MNGDVSIKQPLVSVIIPCYNHGMYLQTAIDSALTQSYPHIEIIVVDDGSTDNTKPVAEDNKTVTYVYQTNQGLSAARNTGIDNSKGEYLVFLDADDWLLKDATRINFNLLTQNPEIVFVSGAHIKVLEGRDVIEEKKVIVDRDHYQRLLMGNFIAMHATVMFRRWVFDQFRYDTDLRALEDYDMYLNISRKFKVLHHQDLIAAYRIHQLNMSGNIPLMLESALKVLKQQESKLINKQEHQSFEYGLRYWKNYYSSSLYLNLARQPWSSIKKNKVALNMLSSYKPSLYIKLLIKKLIYAG
jgi:glycosyltransferase involved in cell wall biosynthesis